MLAASLAQASGFQLLEQNASGLGRAFAGSAAVADDASTVFFNPAGMTELRDREITLGANLISLSAKFSDGGSGTGLPTIPGMPTYSGNGGDAGISALVPNAYLSWKLTDKLWGGLGLGAPFGLKTAYDGPWVGAAQAIHFEVKTLNINPSLAFKPNEQWSFGFGLNIQKLEADYLRNVSVLSPPAPGVPLPLSSSTVQFKADDWGWGWNVGLLFKPSADTRLGLAYRSQVRHTVKGDLRTAGAGGALLAAVADSKAEADIKLPDSVILSISQRLGPQWTLLGDLSWTGWSSIKKVDIVRSNSVAVPGADPSRQTGGVAQTLDTEFRDTWRVALGADYRVDEQWTLKSGLAYDQSPVKGPQTRLVSLPDGNRTWLSAGARWRPDADSKVDFGLARLFVQDVDIDNNQVAAGRGLVRGRYESRAWLLGLEYSRAF